MAAFPHCWLISIAKGSETLKDICIQRVRCFVFAQQQEGEKTRGADDRRCRSVGRSLTHKKNFPPPFFVPVEQTESLLSKIDVAISTAASCSLGAVSVPQAVRNLGCQASI